MVHNFDYDKWFAYKTFHNTCKDASEKHKARTHHEQHMEKVANIIANALSKST
jgi:hypothetical protein